MKKFTLSLLTLVAVTINSMAATTVWSTNETVTGDWAQGVTIDKSSLTSVEAGNIVFVYVTALNSWTPQSGDAYWQCILRQAGGNNSSWDQLTGFNGGISKPGVFRYELTSTNVNEIKAGGINITGKYITFNKVELVTKDETVTLFSGSTATGNWDSNVTWSSNEDKSKLAAVQMNDQITMTYTLTASDAQAAIQTAWTNVVGIDDNTFSSENEANNIRTLTLNINDAAILEKIQQNNIQVRGKNITITDVSHVKLSNRYDAVPLTIGSDGICTYGSSKNLDFSALDGVTPYYASSTTTGLVTLTAVSTTRAWAGYVVRGAAGTYNVPVAVSEPGWIDAFHNLRYSGDYDGNWVYRSAYSDYSDNDNNNDQSTDTDEYKIKNKYRYIFAKDNSSNIGFYKLATDYSREKDNTTVYYHDLAAHKAYLETDTDIAPAGETPAPVLLQFLDGDVTGVKAICDLPVSDLQNGANGCYDLSGRKVDSKSVNGKLRKGIYIVNGRKVVVK